MYQKAEKYRCAITDGTVTQCSDECGLPLQHNILIRL